MNIDVPRRPELRVFGIEDACVADDNRLGQRMAHRRGEVVEALVVRFNLAAFQGCGQGFPARFDDLCPTGKDPSEKLKIGLARRPVVERLDFHSGQRIQRQVAGLALSLEMLVGDFLDRQLTARQCRKVPPRLQCHGPNDPHEDFRRRFHRYVGRWVRAVCAALIGKRLPFGVSVPAREGVVDRCSEGRFAFPRIAQQGAVWGEREFLLEIGPAAVVAIAVVDGDRTIVGDLSGLRLGRFALEEDGVARRASGLCRRRCEQHDQCRRRFA